MRSRSLWIVVAVSLALNLSFIGVWGYSTVTANETKDEGNSLVDGVTEHLLLTIEQREVLMDVRRKARVRWRTLSGSSGALREAVVSGLSQESYDEAAMRDLVASRFGQRSEVIAAIMGDLHRFIGMLSPEQRQAFIELAGQRGFLRGLFKPRRKPTEVN